MISTTSIVNPGFAPRVALAMLQAAKWANFARPCHGVATVKNRAGRIALAVYAQRLQHNGPIVWTFEDNDGRDITALVRQALPNYKGPLPAFRGKV